MSPTMLANAVLIDADPINKSKSIVILQKTPSLKHIFSYRREDKKKWLRLFEEKYDTYRRRKFFSSEHNIFKTNQ